MEKMELSEALKANASVLEGLLGIPNTWFKGDLVKVLLLDEGVNNPGYMFVDKDPIIGVINQIIK